MNKIEFEIKGMNYVIENISIRDYYAIRTDLALDGNEAEFRIISRLSRCPIDLLKQLPVEDWNAITFHFSVLINKSLTDNIEIVNQFTHQGVEYGLLDWDKMTIGEFADLDVIVNASDADNRLHEVLAILYRPIVKKKWKKNIIEDYDYDGFKERCELFLDLPVRIIKAVIGFFLHIGQISLDLTKESLEGKKKNPQTKTVLRILTILQDNGGLQSYISQGETPSKLQELLDSELKKLLTSSPGKSIKPNDKKPSNKKWLKNITT